jgi:hypothetical protein
MRTTVRLDDHLLIEAKRHAAATRRTLTQLLTEGLVAMLERERGAQSPRRVHLPVFRGDGVHDGVDINRSAALLDHMERGGARSDREAV